MIIVECWDMNLGSRQGSEIVSFLRSVGYKLCGAVHTNAIMIEGSTDVADLA